MKITNLIGNEYSGTIGKSVTASKWKGRNYLKKWFKPGNPNSVRQQQVRGAMGAGVNVWQGFTAFLKSAYYWYQRYRKTNISPFNAMIGSYVEQEYASIGSYTPPAGTDIRVTDGVPLPVDGATVIIRKTGQATNYMEVFTDVLGLTYQMVGDEDANYDIFITHPLNPPYSALNQTMAGINTTHVM